VAGTGDGADADGDMVKDDGCPSTKYTYDALNRLQSETDAFGSRNASMHLTRTAA